MRLIDEKNQNLGVVTREEALRCAEEKGLDLIEVAPQADPPVVRIMSFDKFRYREEKEAKRQRLSQKRHDVKRMRITPRAAENDLRIKAGKIDDFLNNGYRVEISVFLRGRERFNKEWIDKKLYQFLGMITVPFRIVMEPKTMGRRIIMQIIKK